MKSALHIKHGIDYTFYAHESMTSYLVAAHINKNIEKVDTFCLKVLTYII